MTDKSAGKLPHSAGIIERDAADELGECLDSLHACDDIVVVVDSRSVDNTEGLARERGARVFVEDWKWYGPQKQSAIEKCRHEHVLLIDADERMTPKAVEEVGRVLSEGFNNNKAPAYAFRRKSHIGGRWIRHSGWWPDRVTRLIDRRRCRMEGMIHERILVDGGRVLNLDAHIEHSTFGSYSDMLPKLDEYSEYTSRELLKKGRGVTLLSPVTHAAWTFIRVYFLRRGFLDGLDGLVIALLNAGGAFFKYAKALDALRHSPPRD